MAVDQFEYVDKYEYVDRFEYGEGTVLILLKLVEHKVMDQFRITAIWDGGGHVNGFEYSLDAIVDPNIPLSDIAKTRMAQKMIARCREDVLLDEWSGYDQELRELERKGASAAEGTEIAADPSSLQMKALLFFERNRDRIRAFKVIDEGSFAVEWYEQGASKIGWMDSGGQNDRYRISGSDDLVSDLLEALGIDPSDVIFMSL